MNENASLTIDGLQLIDYRELKEQLPPDTIRQLPEPPRASGQHGEPGLITAVVIVTVAGIHALSAWLARRSSRPAEGQGFTLTVDPDHKITINVGPAMISGADKGKWIPPSDTQTIEDILNTATSLESS